MAAGAVVWVLWAWAEVRRRRAGRRRRLVGAIGRGESEARGYVLVCRRLHVHALEGNGRRERGFILHRITLTLSYLNFDFF